MYPPSQSSLPGGVPREAWRSLSVFRTSILSDLCGVSDTTVKSWVRTGELSGIGLPCSGHRRVDRDALLLFAKRQRMRHVVNFLESRSGLRIAYFGAEPDSASRALHGESSSIQVFSCSDLFSFGMAFMDCYPDCVVIDMRSPDMVSMCFRLVQHIRPTLEALAIPSVILTRWENEQLPSGTIHSTHDLGALFRLIEKSLAVSQPQPPSDCGRGHGDSSLA